MDIKTITNEMVLSQIISDRDTMILSQHETLGQKDMEILKLQKKIEELEKQIRG